jgi:hypothetical protein
MKTRALGLALALCLGCAVDAGAVSLTLQGQGATLEDSNSNVLYASDSDGEPVLITAVGLPSPDGGAFSELGVPSMMPDGRVLFGAETTAKDKKLNWGIYIGDPNVSPLYRVARAFDPPVLTATKDCAPLLNGDPFPVADAKGNIAFMSHLPEKRDALIYYSEGKLTCLARSGGTTNEGHEMAVLSFGSPQMGDQGQVVFNAWLKYPPEKNDKDAPQGHRQALLIASRQNGITELAVEGEYGPNHAKYARPFGLPAALASPVGTLIAFTAKTQSGSALFLYSNGEMSRILPTGTNTPLGPVSYLSPGRPGLMADGTTAVLAGCARLPVIFRMAHQKLDVRLQRGQLTPFGTELESLGDPVLTASGSMFIGATDTDGSEQLYVLNLDDSFFEVGEPGMIYKIAAGGRHHSIFTGTLTVNERGDFAYLGGK